MDFALRVLREGMYLAILVAAPAVVASLVIGFVMGLVQAATQIHDQTVTFVPRLIAVALTLLALGPWIGAQLVRFTQAVLEGFPQAMP